MRKYAYLSNDSSYSISIEDGVDISLLDNSSSEDDKKILDYMHEQSDFLNSSDSENDSNRLQSFTFESQVFLFYFVDAVLLASVLIVICHLGFKFLNLFMVLFFFFGYWLFYTEREAYGLLLYIMNAASNFFCVFFCTITL